MAAKHDESIEKTGAGQARDSEPEMSWSGRPVYHPSTIEWICWALAVVFAGSGISCFGDGNTVMGIVAVVVAVAAVVAALLIARHRKNR